MAKNSCKGHRNLQLAIPAISTLIEVHRSLGLTMP